MFLNKSTQMDRYLPKMIKQYLNYIFQYIDPKLNNMFLDLTLNKQKLPC